MKSLKASHPVLFLLALLALAACTGPARTIPLEPADGLASDHPAQDRIVILIGLDGLRNDAIDRFPDAAPNLRRLAERGVRAAGMVPAMPSMTFVNFYSIATGLYPEHTGIVSNNSYSRSLGRVMSRKEHSKSEWWGGEPIWVTAEKQGVKTATMFWLGSEAEIKGVRPTYWHPYDHSKPFDARTKQILSWLALAKDESPRLITVYFHAVDAALHSHGLGSDEERRAIEDVDTQVGALVRGVEKLGLQDRTNIIVVSDHGMANAPRANVINLDEIISFDDVLIPEIEGPDGARRSVLVHVFAEDGDIDGIYEQLAKSALIGPFQAYRRDHLPARWHLDNADRTGDIVVVADEGWQLSGHGLTAEPPASGLEGVHGYDRHLPSMLATFIAAGPSFAHGVTTEPFDNVEVYGIIAGILGLRPARTDGDIEHVRHFLTPALSPR